ncbi:sulfotransferase 1C4 isoform X2 [Orussus abietinus]|uniref:sulfotransferase 1C4 isoform X2 n=1 Tax=Orussus abietinus TaxID=222816 RepID=UPI0006267618|nr:sulfotransferase 1C4 isoform X2 [Orussus abietinus]
MPKYQLLDAARTEEILKLFDGQRTGWVQVGEKKWFFPYKYVEQGEKFFNFRAKPDDTWVLSYPRSGTTWTQEMVWLLSNDMDFETAKTIQLNTRFPFLEFSMFVHDELMKEFLEMNNGDPIKQKFCRDMAKPGYEEVARLPSPRFIKSHFPFSLLPGILDSGCKIVYVARNPRDVAVSWYFLNRSFKTQGYVGDFPTFWEYFRNDLTWSPYWEHLKEAWEQRHHPNVLFMFYEEMHEDFIKAIKKVAAFLGKSYPDEKISQLVQYLDIKIFRENKMVNCYEMKECGIMHNGTFIRKGGNGGWKDWFNTPELENSANKWIEDNLKDTSLRFPCVNNNE